MVVVVVYGWWFPKESSLWIGVLPRLPGNTCQSAFICKLHTQDRTRHHNTESRQGRQEVYLRNGQSTAGGPKWTKTDPFRPKWTILVDFGLSNAQIRLGIRSFFRKAPDTFNFLRHAMRAILSFRPKCSHRCVSLKETPLKPVQKTQPSKPL